MSQRSGKLITFEGSDGSGKSTNIELMREYLTKSGVDVLVTREPGGTEVGELVRNILLTCDDLTTTTELLLIFAARAQHIEQVIVPALASGKCVLSDRYIDATYAYQGFGRGMEERVIKAIELVLPNFIKPDLTILFDVPVALSFDRMRLRDNPSDRFEAEAIQFFENVRNGYLYRAKQFPERIKVIDSTQPLSDVENNVKQELKTYLKLQ